MPQHPASVAGWQAGFLLFSAALPVGKIRRWLTPAISFD